MKRFSSGLGGGTCRRHWYIPLLANAVKMMGKGLDSAWEQLFPLISGDKGPVPQGSNLCYRRSSPGLKAEPLLSLLELKFPTRADSLISITIYWSFRSRQRRLSGKKLLLLVIYAVILLFSSPHGEHKAVVLEKSWDASASPEIRPQSRPRSLLVAPHCSEGRHFVLQRALWNRSQNAASISQGGRGKMRY